MLTTRKENGRLYSLPIFLVSFFPNRNLETGYHGSVESMKYKQIWITELKENPHLFETKILTTHSTREEAFEEEIRYQIEHNVVRSPEYINMSIANGKFLHIGHSDESKKKMSEAHKKRYENPEERKKTSESGKGKKRGPYKKKL